MPYDYLCNFILCICFTLYCTIIVARINYLSKMTTVLHGPSSDLLKLSRRCMTVPVFGHDDVRFPVLLIPDGQFMQ